MAYRNSEDFLADLKQRLAKYGISVEQARKGSPMQGSTAFMPLSQVRKEARPEQEGREETEVNGPMSKESTKAAVKKAISAHMPRMVGGHSPDLQQKDWGNPLARNFD